MATKKIKDRFHQKYPITNDTVKVEGRKFHIDYLPFVDLLFQYSRKVAGAALYKVDSDLALVHFTDTRDPKLIDVYEQNKEQADKLAEEVKRRLTEYFGDTSIGHASTLLSGAFHSAFGQTYGEWRKSLQK